MSTKAGQAVKRRATDLTYPADPSCSQWLGYSWLADSPEEDWLRRKRSCFVGCRKCFFSHFYITVVITVGGLRPIRRHDSVEIRLTIRERWANIFWMSEEGKWDNERGSSGFLERFVHPSSFNPPPQRSRTLERTATFIPPVTSHLLVVISPSCHSRSRSLANTGPRTNRSEGRHVLSFTGGRRPAYPAP